MNRRTNPVIKYASFMLTVYALTDMMMGLASRAGVPDIDIVMLFLAGYFLFRSRLVTGIRYDVLVLGMAIIMLFLLSPL